MKKQVSLLLAAVLLLPMFGACATEEKAEIPQYNVSVSNSEGGSVSAVFGGAKCDLRQAVIEKDCVLRVSAIFGGVTVLVPPTVNVKVEANAIFGGVSDKTTRDAGNLVTLYITGESMFGGVEIK